MAKDLFTTLDRCTYCGRPGHTAWDVDLVTCGWEVCESLAWAELQRRAHRGDEAAEKQLERALGGFHRALRRR